MEIKKYTPIVAGVLIGLTAGFFYWLKVGCTTGSCPITSNPFHSAIYGGVMGGLLSNILIDRKKYNKK